MKRVCGLIALAASLVAGFFLQAIPAQAGVPNVPDDVSAWFRDNGAKLVRESSAESGAFKVAESAGDLVFPYGSDIGKPVSVMVWREAFLQAADPTADLLVPRGDWMAPILAQGKPVGTLTAYKSDQGRMEWSMDGDTGSATAIWAAQPTDIVASDGRNGLFVVNADVARQYGPSNWAAASTPGSLKQLQAALLDQQADDKAQADEAGAPVLGGAPLLFADYVRDHPVTPVAVGAPVDQAASANTMAPSLIAGIAILGGCLVVGVFLRRRRLATP